MEVFFQVLAILGITATILSLTERKAWWIRAVEFPRPQILVIMLITIFGLILSKPEISWTNGILATVAFISVIVQTWFIYPYFKISSRAVKNSTGSEKYKISILIANVLMDNRTSHILVEQINKYKPDIFLAVETDVWWEEQLKPATNDFPYCLTKPLDNTYGMLLFSKLPLKNGRIEYIIKDEIPSAHADVVLNDKVIKLSCLHPEPPAPGEAETSKPRDRELGRMARKIQKIDEPYIVIGDFNDVAWSKTSYLFESLSGLKDPRRGRGFLNTFHAKYPLFRWALDHIFISEHFTLEKMKTLSYNGSDHFPVYVICAID
ncbi:MAG: endonuclease/exonuclease/phosphatase family protein [Bacteroidales bacterium]|nr:endonuclease/exonuclease/phosphatase family protein [Bacteroidales bacterium]